VSRDPQQQTDGRDHQAYFIVGCPSQSALTA
jgi:hypothetical protein